ncbi:hypothetical protein M0Q50_00190 [bacterium]|jgi:hypothetical protein|nr:hypothetical protein [bacterium]
MEYINKINLFNDWGSINEYIEEKNLSLKNKINSLNFDNFKKGDDVLIAELISVYTIEIPKIVDTEDNIKIDAQEDNINIHSDNYQFNYGRNEPSFAKGLSIIVKVSFIGNSSLFRHRPSRYTSSGTPSAEVNNKYITLSYKTIEKDPDKIKKLWINDIEEIKKNLGWIENDVKIYNDSIGEKIKTMIKNRKKEINEYNSLIEKIKEK